MAEVSPQLAVKLALGIYDTKDAFELNIFLDRKEFSQQPAQQKQLMAVVGTRLINTSDAFGACVRGAEAYERDIFLIFRGTTGRNLGADWVTDARTGLTVGQTGALVHSGFSQTFNSMVNDLALFLGQQANATTVHCIGHSLGGAVANLTADWVSKEYSHLKTRLYTFGSPRVGWGASGFAYALTSKLGPENIYRVYHGTDPVTMVPVYPFEHAPTWGQACYLPYGGLVLNFKAHKMTSYKDTIGSETWETLRKPAPSFSSDIKAWLQNDSDENTQSASFWEKLNIAAAHIVQNTLSIVAIPLVNSLTVADYLAMILAKAVQVAADVSKWAFLLIRKLMKMVGMKVADTVEELTETIIKSVLRMILQRIEREVIKAIEQQS